MTEASSLGFDTCAAHAIIKVMNIYSVSQKNVQSLTVNMIFRANDNKVLIKNLYQSATEVVQT